MNAQNAVFVVDADRRPMTPCRPARARQLLRSGEAAVLRRFPFTLILKESKPDAIVAPVTVKVDPGSKTTGLALVQSGRVVFAAELHHRGLAIKDALEARRAQRRSRRQRNTRYRAQRFDNRVRPAGWLPPSLAHRVLTTMTWVRRFGRLAPVKALTLESVKFDMQLMQNPEVSGVEYQQGELQGYTVREYLLEKWGRQCAYCDKANVPLQIEHVVCRADHGSNRVSNLTLACRPCNEKKGSRDVRDFLKRDPERLARILSKLKQPLRDAAAVNATRNAILAAFRATTLPVETGDGARTKYNRIRQNYPKAHWIDAACAGTSGWDVLLDASMKPLRLTATGHGTRQRVRPDRNGFPIAHAPRQKQFAGFQTGDIVRAIIPTGKSAGTHVGRIAIRHRPSFVLRTEAAKFDVHPKYLCKLHQADGYAYH